MEDAIGFIRNLKSLNSRRTSMLQETEKLYKVFDENQKTKINIIIQQILKEGEDYKTIELWKFDQTLGGIGGYCQGCDPAKSNPFQGTEFRNVHRCLQYVRSILDILNINDTARYVIEDCGHYLEEVIKLYLKKKKIHCWIKTIKYPLGKLLLYVISKDIFEINTINNLRLFLKIYNISKHEILSDEKLDRTFHADDAIICYFACRIVGKEIMLKVDREIKEQIYEIDWDKYGRRINRF